MRFFLFVLLGLAALAVVTALVDYSYIWTFWFVVYVVIMQGLARWGQGWGVAALIVTSIGALLGLGAYMMNPPLFGTIATWALLISFLLIPYCWRIKVVADRRIKRAERIEALVLKRQRQTLEYHFD